MYCPNCGTYNEDSYNNCVSCGKYIADINKNVKPSGAGLDITGEISAGTDIDIHGETKQPAEETKPNSDRAEVSAYQNADIEERQEDMSSDNAGEEKKHTPDKKYYEAIYRQYVKRPKEYFVASILCTIFGSLGFGIAAIVFSVMTKAEVNSGNIKKAGIYSQNTRTFCIFSIVIGIIKYLFVFFMLIRFFSIINFYRAPIFWR